MKKPTIKQVGGLTLAVAAGGAILWAGGGAHAGDTGEGAAPAAASAPVLSVQAVQPQRDTWATTLDANGSIAAWQEAVVGSELGGLRLAEVRVNVGDTVQRGEVLARFTGDSVSAELAQQQAALEDTAAALSEAQANARRARTLAASGAISGQQIEQYMTAERSAQARLNLADARVKVERIRRTQVDVVAPDDGVISARGATVGAVAQQGQELFRLIRKSRIEWRAEVPSSEIGRVREGQRVTLRAAGGDPIEGRVRMVAPSVDPATRSALVYVDLPAGSPARAGMFASGRFELGSAKALTLPQSAVVTNDGRSYVFVVGAKGVVEQTEVALGRRQGARVEVLKGVVQEAAVVAQGAGFLNDGDTVKVLLATKPASLAAKSAPLAVR